MIVTEARLARCIAGRDRNCRYLTRSVHREQMFVPRLLSRQFRPLMRTGLQSGTAPSVNNKTVIIRRPLIVRSTIGVAMQVTKR